MEKFQKYIETNISSKQRIFQKVWLICSCFLFKPFSSNIFNFWRVGVLKLFGAKIGKGSIVYSTVYAPAPWNLKMGTYSCLGPQVQLHIDKIIIGDKVTVSQRTYLCNGSHDINYLNTPFISKPIELKNHSWIAAEAFIAPGVTIGEGAIVGARGVVFKDVEKWTVVGGNPAKFIKKRVLNR